MIFDHIVLTVSDHKKSKHFYAKALLPLKITLILEEGECAGFGSQGKPSLWICQEDHPQIPMHIAFIAEDRNSVDEFYKAAMAAGGRSNGEPGIREQYHPNYYGAFVLDPDGHNIEAVCRKPGERSFC